MSIILCITGLALVLLVLCDALWTTLTVNFAGPFTTRLLNGFRRLTVRHGELRVRPRHFWMIGPSVLVLSLCSWVVLLWLGWLLFFVSSPEAVKYTQAETVADFWGRVYFSGYTVITLGNGDYRPGGPIWQVGTAISAMTGFILVTLAISYVLPVLAASVEERQLAFYISTLGPRPEDLVLTGWNGRDFSALNTHLVALAPMLALLAERHRAYPILHHFTSASRHDAIAPSLALLHDALQLLRYGVEERHRPPDAVLVPAERCLGKFLTVLRLAFVDPIRKTAPPPMLSLLRAGGIGCRSDHEFLASLHVSEADRQLLMAHMQATGWSREGDHINEE